MTQPPAHLQHILAYKTAEVESLLADEQRCQALQARAGRRNAVGAARSLAGAIRSKNLAGETAIIAECKRASPSKGVLREDYQPAQLAQSYQSGGAAGISVLTDTPSFAGTLQHMASVSESVGIPVLRKDFMLHPIQVVEARAYGGDAVLVIMAALTDEQASALCLAARHWGMDVLVEVHNESELRRACEVTSAVYCVSEAGAASAERRALAHPSSGAAVQERGDFIIGVNNRDLNTFVVDISTTEKLAPPFFASWLGERGLLISESGISQPEQVHRLHRAGVHGFLIGEAFMRASSPGAALNEIAAQSKRGARPPVARR